MVVKQYPHYLFALVGGEATQNNDGDFVTPGEAVPQFISACREETDGRGTEIKVADGTFHKITSLIQLPKGSPKVEIGTTVFVTNDPDGVDVRIKGVVLKFDNGQLHSRLWV
jgi:hypothetical protein